MDIIKQAALQIRYHERMDEVVVQAYGMDGKANFNGQKRMKHENLPALYFQLLDNGFRLTPDDAPHTDFKVVYAFSKAWVAHVEAKKKADAS